MNYLLINGSPRGHNSNSRLLLSLLKEGMERKSISHNIEIITLRPMLENKNWMTFIKKADYIIIAFPLYADHVPGILKKFIEELGSQSLQNKKLGWISQCGFPESIHLETVEKYLKKLTKRLGAQNIGIIKKAGAEGIRLIPPQMTAKLFEKIRVFGEDLIQKGVFDEEAINRLKKPRRYNLFKRILIRFLSLIGLTNMYWNSQLKKNHAYKNRFAQPYGDGGRG